MLARVPVVPAPALVVEDSGVRRLLTSQDKPRMTDNVFKVAPHTPAHLFRAEAIYMITGATYQKQAIMQTDARKSEWCNSFIKASELYGWTVIAWTVLDNHYHVIVKSPEQNPANLPKYVGSFHKFTARRWNDGDRTTDRKVWWNYWDTCIRSEQDFINRLKYVFWNPIKHGYVDKPNDYKYSNYSFFLKAYFFSEGFESNNEVKDVPEF